MINRRDKSGNVANHPPAQANNKRLSVEPRSDHSVADRASLLKRLRFFARWDCDHH